MKHIKPIIFLIFIIPFLTELLTYNIPAQNFFHPITFLSLLIFYGLAVLVLRELAIRWNIGWVGILIFGLAYGFFNEGIVAKTLVNQTTSAYGSYPLINGFNISTSLVLISWHALFSFCFPILIVYQLFSKYKNKKWLSNFWLTIISIFVILFGLFSETQHTADHIQILFFCFLILVLILSAKFFKTKLEVKKEETKILPIIFGFVYFLIYWIGIDTITSRHLSLIILFAYFLIMAIVGFQILKRKNWLTEKSFLHFGLGGYMMHAFLLLLMVGLLQNKFDAVLSGAGLIIGLTILLIIINKNNIL